MSINWPEYYRPDQTAVHVSNTIDIDAPPSVVWAWLIRAPLWETYYDNAKDLTYLNQNVQDAPDLTKGTRFKWTTFGISVESQVIEFVVNERITWTGAHTGLDVVHGWILTPTATGTHVLTEETQNGALAHLGKLTKPKSMHDGHQRWLEGLAAQAKTGMPQSSNTNKDASKLASASSSTSSTSTTSTATTSSH